MQTVAEIKQALRAAKRSGKQVTFGESTVFWNATKSKWCIVGTETTFVDRISLVLVRYEGFAGLAQCEAKSVQFPEPVMLAITAYSDENPQWPALVESMRDQSSAGTLTVEEKAERQAILDSKNLRLWWG